MPEEPIAPAASPPPRPRRRVPSARRFAAGAVASFVAVFGVLALRVHDGDDPALAGVAKKTTTSSTETTSSTSTSTDPYDLSSSSSDGSSSTSSDGSSSTGSGDDSTSSSDDLSSGASSDDSSGAVSSTPGASTGAS